MELQAELLEGGLVVSSFPSKSDYDQSEQANEGLLDRNQDIQPAGRATISMV